MGNYILISNLNHTQINLNFMKDWNLEANIIKLLEEVLKYPNYRGIDKIS